MNQKAYSILFCALLASTFAHEIRAKAADSPSFAAQIQGRAASSTSCALRCHDTGGDISIGLNITAVNESTLVIVNITAQVAVAINIQESIVVVFNGTAGSAVAINIETKVGVLIKTGAWYALKISIDAYIASLKSFSVLFQLAGAVAFKLSSVPKAALIIVTEVIASLVLNIRGELEISETRALEILIAVATVKIALLKGVLNGFLKIVGTGLIFIRYDLLGFLNLVQGLGVLFGKFSGGLLGLIQAGVAFEIAALAAARNGLALFIVIILAIGTKVDIGKALGGILNDVEAFFELIAQLGGYANVGLNGLFKVIALLVAFINGKILLEILIIGLVQFLGVSIKEDLSAEFNLLLSLLIEAIEKVGATASLSTLVGSIQALIKGTLIIKGIIIGEIIKILLTATLKGGSYLLQALVAVLVQLKSIVAVSVSLPLFFLILIVNIKTAIGLQLLKALGIVIDVSITASGNIIAYILKALVASLTEILRGNLWKAVTSLPVIGAIVKALIAAVSVATNGTISFEALVQASASIQASIKALLQYLFGVKLGATSDQLAKIKFLATQVISISASYNVTITGYSIGVA